MSTYEPGTVAEIGWPMTSGRERALFDGDFWQTESGIRVDAQHTTDVRPLIVLDFADAPWGMGGSYPTWLRRSASHDAAAQASGNYRPEFLRWLADQIEAQTRPPRIPEPRGQWAVVEATGVHGTRFQAVRWTALGDRAWLDASGTWFEWSDLIDPVLIRDGIEDQS
jgi:hypothetical protein